MEQVFYSSRLKLSPCYKYIDLAILRFLINYIMNFSLVSPADIVSGE